MKKRMVVSVVIFLFAGLAHLYAQSFERAGNKALIQTISGALLYIEDSQLRLPKSFGREHRRQKRDSTKTLFYYLRHYQPDCFYRLRNDRKTAIWESKIAFIPKNLQAGGKPVFKAPDDNLYMMLHTAYPFYLFSDDKEYGSLSVIKMKVSHRIGLFKRGAGYNFWMEFPGSTSAIRRTGPPNIPSRFAGKLAAFLLNPAIKRYYHDLTDGLDVVPPSWINDIRSGENPSGQDALFNIPDDADDTSVAVALQILFFKEFAGTVNPCIGNMKPDTAALRLFSHFRDLNRIKEDGRDAWKGYSTGAYLTWLKDENLPVFSHCESGVIPLGVNNVDATINANILFSLGISGIKNLPGYDDALRLINRAVSEKRWEEASLYYPQKMMLPYAVSRAWRDGNVKDSLMERTVSLLLVQLLDLQDQYAKTHPYQKGAFPGGEDHTLHLSTALGLCSLLNIGETVAENCGEKERYQKAVQSSVDFLIKEKQKYKVRHKDTFAAWRGESCCFSRSTGYQWDEGTVFSSSFSDLAHWSSKAYTVSMVIEALTKYLLEYDKHDYNILNGPRVRILAYPSDAISNPLAFEIKYHTKQFAIKTDQK